MTPPHRRLKNPLPPPSQLSRSASPTRPLSLPSPASGTRRGGALLSHNAGRAPARNRRRSERWSGPHPPSLSARFALPARLNSSLRPLPLLAFAAISVPLSPRCRRPPRSGAGTARSWREFAGGESRAIDHLAAQGRRIAGPSLSRERERAGGRERRGREGRGREEDGGRSWTLGLRGVLTGGAATSGRWFSDSCEPPPPARLAIHGGARGRDWEGGRRRGEKREKERERGRAPPPFGPCLLGVLRRSNGGPLGRTKPIKQLYTNRLATTAICLQDGLRSILNVRLEVSLDLFETKHMLRLRKEKQENYRSCRASSIPQQGSRALNFSPRNKPLSNSSL